MKKDVIDAFVDNLDGRLPYMNTEEKENYEKLGKKIKEKLSKIINCFVDGEDDDFVVPKIKELIDLLQAQNSILNDCYYKDGIRLGFNLKKDLLPKNERNSTINNAVQN